MDSAPLYRDVGCVGKLDNLRTRTTEMCGTRKRERLARSEALAVDDRGPRLVVLLLGDPHLLEGGERREDGAADPGPSTCARGGQ